MLIMNPFKRLFCKHKFKTLTNISGDAILFFNGARSISECEYCGKTKYGPLDKKCKEVNKF